MRLSKNFLNSCWKVFGHIRLSFVSYRDKNVKFDRFWFKLKRLYKNITRFKIIFKVISRNKIEYSYLTVNLGEIKSSDYTRMKKLLNDNIVSDYTEVTGIGGTKRWDPKYNWDDLKIHLKKYGQLQRIRVNICNEFDPESNKYCRYCISDGNHRITILKELYPPNYKVEIKISNNVFNK
jgi:hypothetical protein